MHPAATATVKRTTYTELSTGKKRRSVSSPGTVIGGYEDLASKGIVIDAMGKNIALKGRFYADAAQDIPVLMGDVLEFTDAATSQALSLLVVSRRGPWDSSDDEDRFELDLGSEQPTGGMRTQ